MQTNGLIVNGQKIDKISGPISFYLLTPKNSEDNEHLNLKKNKIYPPVIILFGDKHFDMSNLCSNCEKKHNCYNIWSQNLLDLFDNIGSKIKVDFNIEHGFGVRDLEYYVYDNYRGPLTFLKNNILPCFFKEKCPTKRVILSN